MSGGTFSQHRQVGVCKICRTEIDYVNCPTGDWWSHAVHPDDDHDAVYLEGQKTTPAEAMVLLTAWLKWHGHVLQCEVRDEPQMRLYSVETWDNYGFGAGYLTDAADVSGSPVLHSWSTIGAKEWHEKYRPIDFTIREVADR